VGNGFPGLAVVSVIALLVALGVGALAILQPWETDAVAPQLSVAPGLGVGLGGSVVVARDARDRQLAVEPAQPAAGGASRLAAADVSVEEGEPQPRLGIAAARVVVAGSRPDAPSQGSPQPVQPEPAPAPQPAPVPVSVPVVTPPPPVEPVVAPPTRGTGGGTSGPVVGGIEGSGAFEAFEVCEGDDYTLPLLPLEGAEASEVPPSVVTHDLTVYFGSSSEGTGFYLVLFDGLPVALGDDPVPAEPGRSCAQIDLGPLLGGPVEAGTVLHVEAATLGEEPEPVVP
jgi:hypothetical protein